MSEVLWTPMHIHWCVVFYTRSKPVEELGKEHFDSDIGREVFAWMLNEQLIEWDSKLEVYTPQPRLRAFLLHLCAQPLPVQQWVIPND